MANDHRRRWSALTLIAVALIAATAGMALGVTLARAHVRLEPGPPLRPATASGDPMRASNSPAVARNPQRPGNIVVVNRIEMPGYGALLSWSDDGGATWGRRDLPLPAGLDRPYDPDVAFAPDGTLHVVYVNLHGAGNTPDHLWLANSSNGGRSLSPPILVTGPLAYQPRLAVGPEGTVFVTWLQGVGVGQLSLTGAPSPVMAATSSDGGRSFSPPVQVSDAARLRVGAATPVVASDGSLVVLYEDFGGDVRDFQNLDGPVWSDPFTLVVTRSDDAGESFSPGHEVDGSVIPTERFIAYQPPFPSLAAGPDGSLVVAWADGRHGEPDILLRRSTDLGGTWRAPVVVNGDAVGHGIRHRLPTVSVSPDGRIDALYLENRRHPSGFDLEVHLGSSSDSGRSFVDQLVSPSPFDGTIGPVIRSGHVDPDLGPRLGLVSDDDRVLAVWTDTGLGTRESGRQNVALVRVGVSGRERLGGILAAAALLSIALVSALAALARLQPARARAFQTRTGAVVNAGAGAWRRRRAGRPAVEARPAMPLVASFHLHVGPRAYPVVLPKLRDPRLHVAACLLTVQVLGQVALDFQISIAQILLSLGVCAVLELGITFAQRRAFIWPASALLTGNGVALIFRVPGTQHGDWWSLRGAWIFIFAAALSLLSKYVIRLRGRHFFNPSNIGLVVSFLLFGSTRVDPQDLWFGPMSVGLALTYAIILAGGLLITRRLKMLSLTGSFVAGFAALIGVIALGGHCMTARWSVGPVCGGYYWSTVVFSPEILIFMFFMITDPQTTPRGRWARIAYGFGVAFLGALLAAPQQTEFGTKVAILGALVLVCALQPLLRRYSSMGAVMARLTPIRGFRPAAGRLALSVTAVVAILGVCGGLVAAAGIPARGGLAAGVDLAALRAQAAARPTIVLEPGSVPQVQIAGDVRGADGSVTEAGAQRMGRAVVEDLVIGADALQRIDPKLAAAVSFGPWLQSSLREIRSAKRAGQRVVKHYRFDQLRLVVASNPNDYQASKEVAVEVRGSVDRVIMASGSGDHIVGQSTSPFNRVLAIQRAGEHYLIAADYTPS